MNALRLALCALAVCGGAACMTTPPPHARALENNELCAQQLAAGELNKAEVYCDLGLEFSPQYADLWVNKGLIYLRRDNIPRAKDAFIKALRYNQEQAQAYNNLGFIYLKETAYGKAYDNFIRALKVNPDYTEARYNLALALMHMKKYAAARKEFETILAVNSNLADPHHYLGYMSLSEGKCQDAIPSLERATHLDPTYTEAWFNLANAYNECGKFNDAKDALVSCVRADENHIQCKNNLAIINRKVALLDPTLKDMKSDQRAENTPQASYQLARTYGEKGLRFEQKRELKRCLDLNPKYAPCHHGLHRLFDDDQRIDDAKNACKNFLKFVVAEEFPKEVQACEKYLNSH